MQVGSCLAPCILQALYDIKVDLICLFLVCLPRQWNLPWQMYADLKRSYIPLQHCFGEN
jgi:hypothetical protein